jgi:hypothetical protein
MVDRTQLLALFGFFEKLQGGFLLFFLDHPFVKNVPVVGEHSAKLPTGVFSTLNRLSGVGLR